MSEVAGESARHIVRQLLAGEESKDEHPDQLGLYSDLIEEMRRAVTEGGSRAARLVFEMYARQDPGIAALGAADEDDEDEERSPLPTELNGDLELGWIDWYTSLMTELTGSPREFNRLIGLATAATAI